MHITSIHTHICGSTRCFAIFDAFWLCWYISYILLTPVWADLDLFKDFPTVRMAWLIFWPVICKQRCDKTTIEELLPGLSDDSTTCSRRGPSLVSARAVVGAIPGPIGRREFVVKFGALLKLTKTERIWLRFTVYIGISLFFKPWVAWARMSVII